MEADVEQADEPHDPYAAPGADTAPPLGSLAQSARGKALKGAQVILILIGLLTVALNGFLLYNLENEIRAAAVEQQVPPEQMDEFREAVQIGGALMYGIPILIGLVFVVFGVIVKSYPVPVTTAGLVLYVLAAVGFGILDPSTLARGIFMKVIIVLALFRAWKAARAHEAEARAVGAFG